MANGRVNKNRKSTRNSNGAMLIELLVALFIAGYLTAVLGSSLAQLISLSSSTQQTQAASLIAQEIIERIRNTPYSQLTTYIGTATPYSVRINNGDLGDSNSYLTFEPFNRPLQLDAVNLAYTTGNSAVPMPSYMFGSNINASATVSFAPGPVNTALVTVNVAWNAPANGTRSYTCQAIIYQNGTQQNVSM